MDHSVLGFSHEMKVLHIDLIERPAEIAICSFQVLQKSDGSSPTYPPNSQIGAPLSPSKQPVMVSSSGLSSAASALFESSSCKVFCTQQRHCDGHIVGHTPGACQNGSAVHSTPSRLLSARLVHCYCLIHYTYTVGLRRKHLPNHCKQNILAILIFGC